MSLISFLSLPSSIFIFSLETLAPPLIEILTALSTKGSATSSLLAWPLRGSGRSRCRSTSAMVMVVVIFLLLWWEEMSLRYLTKNLLRSNIYIYIYDLVRLQSGFLVLIICLN
ncbi:hypothetical protein CsSME_00040806 [Camellia sinensis var. sinensis]